MASRRRNKKTTMDAVYSDPDPATNHEPDGDAIGQVDLRSAARLPFGVVLAHPRANRRSSAKRA